MRADFCRLTLLSALPLAGFCQQVDDATLSQYNAILDREHTGGHISKQERDLLMSVYPKLNPAHDSLGLIPLTYLGKGSYKGEQGGLYPGGENVPPPAHFKAGIEVARRIVPLDADGHPSPDGKIALLSISMSNTTMEYQTLLKLAAGDKELNPHLVLVDGAQGGQSAVERSDPTSNFWKVVDKRMADAGVSANQVQAIWMYQVIVAPFRLFPVDVRRLQAMMVETLHFANSRFPNLKIAYLSSRNYAGYAQVPQNPEPHAYESGFASKWIIADQIAGFPEFNYDPERGKALFPWVARGPYTWADGVKPRSDDLTWSRDELAAPDGMHPSNLGREKVAKMLLQFLKTSPTSKMWVLAQAPQAARREQYMAAHPPRSSVGLTALTDLGAGKYKGEQGGLYPGGSNSVPPEHLTAGLKIASQVVPLDAEGSPSPNGKIVMLCVGFSNPTIEFASFKPAADAYPGRNPSLVVINTCVGSQAAPTIADPNSGYWKIVGQRIKDAGVTPRQVQVIWMKQVIPGNAGEFPAFAKKLQGYIEDTLHNAHDKFPNLKLAYLSSRTYGGWTELGGSPEPMAYETGFAVKWVIADQLAGKPELNYDPAKGAVRSPWIEWGPYLWTDGVKGRRDGMVYLRSDTREDGLHPSESGTKKVVKLLMDFFETDPTARLWFVKQ